MCFNWVSGTFDMFDFVYLLCCLMIEPWRKVSLFNVLLSIMNPNLFVRFFCDLCN